MAEGIHNNMVMFNDISITDQVLNLKRSSEATNAIFYVSQSQVRTTVDLMGGGDADGFPLFLLSSGKN